MYDPNSPTPSRIAARRLLIGVICAIWCLNVVYSIRWPVWSQRDEIAHFDYIDRVSDGSLPDPHDDISAYTFSLTGNQFEWLRPSTFNGSRPSMGLAGKSYEAQQPPLYYAVLALPHKMLKGRIPAAAEVRVLRLLSLLFVALAAGVILVTATKLYAVNAGLAVATDVAAFVLSTTNIASYATLGNDALSALFGAFTLFLLVRIPQDLGRRSLVAAMALVVVAAGLFVKPTNMLLVLAPLALVALPPPNFSRLTWFRRCAFPLLPLLTLPAALLIRALQSGSAVQSVAVRDYFASWVRPLPTTYEFVTALLCNSIDLYPAGITIPRGAALALFIMLCLAATDFIIAARRGCECLVLPLGAAALGMAFGTLAIGATLNSWSPGVPWYLFRHYVATLPFLVVGMMFPFRHLSRSALPGVYIACSAMGCILLFRMATMLR